MKLLLENWNKFLQEQEINEATEEEIEHLMDALEIPIEDLPFSNIFGNSYRIIEPFTSMSETTSFGVTMMALKKFGWDVASPKDRKILCTKTKVTHFISGKGEPGISRKSVTLNLPKVLAGIVNFAKGSRDKLSKEAGAEMFTAAKRFAYASKEGRLDELPENVKYSLPADISDPNIKHTANEYRKIMKFYDNQVYWLGSTSSLSLKNFMDAIGVNFESFENYSTYVNDSMDDLMNNIDKYVVPNYVIYSRHPIDVFRMSDHEHIIKANPQNCHRLPSEKKEQPSYDMYNKCSLSEAYGNGMIAYVVPAKDFKMFPPTQESLNKMNDQEIFYDKMRDPEGGGGSGELVPISRIRIMNVAFHKDENSEPIRIAVPQGKVYEPRYPGFIDAVGDKMAKVQEKEVKEIIKQGSEDLGKPTIFLSKFTRYGGSYQDGGYSVADTLPKLFRKVSKDINFQGSSVRYDQSIEDSVLAAIGQSSAGTMRQRLDEIFSDHMGGFISYTWEVEEDHDGQPFYEWKMIVTFYMNIPEENANGSEIRNAVVDVVDGMATDYYGLPETDNVFVSLYDEDKWQIQLVYDGNDFEETSYLDGLESNLPEIVEKFNVFDYYHEDGAIQLIEYTLEEYGVIPSERYKIRDALRDFGLPDDSWWNEDESETAEHDYFGGEYIEFISFTDKFSYFPHETIEKIPENMREEAYRYIAEFINSIVTNDEASTKLAYNKDSYDDSVDNDVVIMMDSERTLDMHWMRLKELVEAEEEIEMRAGISLYNDYPTEMLQNTAKFLRDDASIDEISERFEAQLEKHVASKLKGEHLVESKKRMRIHVRR